MPDGALTRLDAIADRNAQFKAALDARDDVPEFPPVEPPPEA